MPGKTEYVYWDTCVFLYFLSRDPTRHPAIEAALDELKSTGRRRVATSLIAKVEVAYLDCEALNRELNPALEQQIDLLWSDYSVFQVVEFSEPIALAARSLVRQAKEECLRVDGQRSRGLKPPDAIHLATAQWLGASRICSYDPHLTHWAHLVGIPVVEPQPIQPRLLNHT